MAVETQGHLGETLMKISCSAWVSGLLGISSESSAAGEPFPTKHR